MPGALSLCTGIGGLDLGLEWAGWTITGQVEIDPWCRARLATHWPEVPRHDDLRTAAAWWGRRPVDLVCGGLPCQPVSKAGRHLAQADPRWLWPHMAAVIAAARPTWVLAENVPGLRTNGLTVILTDLAQLGYTARAGTVSACEMGAPHPRARLFVLAHTRRLLHRHGHDGTEPVLPHPAAADAGGGPAVHHGDHWAAEPRMDRVAHGVPAQVDQLRAYGNAVVPQVAEHLGRLILATGEKGTSPWHVTSR